MYYLDALPNPRPDGFVNTFSTAGEWNAWLLRVVPTTLDMNVRNFLCANLRHILVGLEMKAALIVPHHVRNAGDRPLLFESYAQIMTFEFCVGTFSVCEGLGSAFHLHNENDDGLNSRRINSNVWIPVLGAAADPNGALDLETKLLAVRDVRDKLHQDQLGARNRIDWHDFDYDHAFVPAKEALQVLFQMQHAHVPPSTNLTTV